MQDHLKRLIVRDHERRVGRHDSAKIYGGPPGDPGLTGPGSVSWKVNSDVGAISVGGIAAIVLEILHPSVMSGVQQQSSYASDPDRRARTTYGYVVATTFGNTQAAEKLIAGVKRIHSRINGTRPDGVPYRALDPELVGWVHTAIPWAVMGAYERFHEPLEPWERDAYLREQAVIGRLGGAEEIPETAAELDAYLLAMRPKLAITGETREFFEFLLTPPKGSLGSRLPDPIGRRSLRFQLASGLSLLPDWAYELAGFHNSVAVQKLLGDPSLQLAASSLRWAFGPEPPFRALAEERVAAGRDRDASAAAGLAQAA